MVDRDEDAPASEEEVKLAEKLRRSLETGASTPDGDFLRAVSLAHEPRELDKKDNERLIEVALARAPRRSNVVRIVFGGATVVALAASVLLFVLTQGTSATRAELVPVRSTQPLFDKPFDAKASTSARIDRIAMAREGDLRENRFSRWGVR